MHAKRRGAMDDDTSPTTRGRASTVAVVTRRRSFTHEARQEAEAAAAAAEAIRECQQLAGAGVTSPECEQILAAIPTSTGRRLSSIVAPSNPDWMDSFDSAVAAFRSCIARGERLLTSAHRLAGGPRRRPDCRAVPRGDGRSADRAASVVSFGAVVGRARRRGQPRRLRASLVSYIR